MKHLGFVFSILCLLQCSAATSLILDFGDVSNPNFGVTEDTIQYSGVATGINATLVAENSYTSVKPNDNGSVGGNIRVNAALGETVTLRLQLWDASLGDGFSAPYNPGSPYQWTLIFYDIDSTSPLPSNRWDVITLLSPGTVTTTTTTALDVDFTVADQVTLSGQFAGQVETEIQDPITDAQADVAAAFTMINRSDARFIYQVAGSSGNDRVMFVDGGRISFGDRETTTLNVPEPSAVLSLIFSALLSCFRRRR